MNLELFVDTYEAKKHTASGDEFLKEHITNEYVPYETKIDIVTAIVNASSHEEAQGVDGEIYTEFRLNSPARKMLVDMALVDLYTDIDRNKDTSNMLADYNMLRKTGILTKILDAIPEQELREFKEMVHLVERDVQINEYEPHGYFRRQVERFGTLIGAVLAPVIQGIDFSAVENILKEYVPKKD